MCRKFARIAENLQVLQKMCRKSAGIAENMLVLQKICRYCRISSGQNTCEHKDHIKNNLRQYRKNNRERINEYWRSYYAKNKEQINQRLRTKGKEKQEPGTKSLRNWKRVPQWTSDLKPIMQRCWGTLLRRQSLKSRCLISRSLTFFLTPLVVHLSS